MFSSLKAANDGVNSCLDLSKLDQLFSKGQHGGNSASCAVTLSVAPNEGNLWHPATADDACKVSRRSYAGNTPHPPQLE